MTSLISAELGIRIDRAGLLVTLTQLGYGAGLLLLVPLAILEMLCLLLASFAQSVSRVTTFFIGGAFCSALSTWCSARFSWPGVALAGSALPLTALVYFLTE